MSDETGVLPQADNNPMSEIDPQALQELFTRDPNEYSEQDIDSIVYQFRKMRHLWENEEATAKKSGRRANSNVTKGKSDKPKITKEEALNLTVGDLKLDI